MASWPVLTPRSGRKSQAKTSSGAESGAAHLPLSGWLRFKRRHLSLVMNRVAGFTAVTMIALGLSIAASAQSSSPSTNATQTPAASQADKQSNAASATQDNSGISGDQVTKPAGAKSSTVIGCLSGPDAGGHFMLNSMQYRSGLEVLGPNNLDTADGRKVKLTGQWIAGADSQDASDKKDRRFQATTFDVLADKCPPPSATTPVSKKKQQQQKAESQNNPQ